MKRPTINTESLLRRILARNPRATVDEIRRAYPIFRTVSYDHLALRLDRLLDRDDGAVAK